MSAPSGVQRLLVQYTGNVQGVGFRYTVRSVARGFQVTGSVKNLPDGRVRLEVQGEPAEVERFLAAVRAEFARNIQRADREELSICEGESGFRIEH